MKPILQALLIAEKIYQDKLSNKYIVAGIFNTFQFKRQSEIPPKLDKDGLVKLAGGQNAGSPSAYISLTEIRGKMSFVLQYVALKEDKVLMSTEFTVESANPLAVAEVVLPLPNLPSMAGVHALELLLDGTPLGSIRVTGIDATEIV